MSPTGTISLISFVLSHFFHFERKKSSWFVIQQHIYKKFYDPEVLSIINRDRAQVESDADIVVYALEIYFLKQVIILMHCLMRKPPMKMT